MKKIRAIAALLTLLALGALFGYETQPWLHRTTPFTGIASLAPPPDNFPPPTGG